MSLNYTLIGRRIKETRISKQLTQAKLAEKVDISVTYISRIETASKKASLESLVRIANVLGVSVDILLVGNQTINPTEYLPEMENILIDCTSYEKRIIYETVSSLKCCLRNNYCLNKDTFNTRTC